MPLKGLRVVGTGETMSAYVAGYQLTRGGRDAAWANKNVEMPETFVGHAVSDEIQEVEEKCKEERWFEGGKNWAVMAQKALAVKGITRKRWEQLRDRERVTRTSRLVRDVVEDMAAAAKIVQY